MTASWRDLPGSVAGLLSGPAGAPARRLGDRVQGLAYGGGWAVVKTLPEPVAAGLFRAGADLAVRRGGTGVEQLRANLSRVAPGQDLLLGAMRSYARYWCEVFRLPVISHERVVDGMQTTGRELFQGALDAPTGTVLALPHSGNWDHAGAWCSLTGAPFTTVAERLEPASVFDRFVAFRQSLGMEVLPLTGGQRPAYRVMVERLREGRTLCLLADRDLSARGIDVDFFGATARMPAGPARLALATGAVLLPVTLSFRPGGWAVVWHPAVEHTDVATMTQQVADAFARGIAAHPGDWHRLQPLWLADLPARTRVRP